MADTVDMAVATEVTAAAMEDTAAATVAVTAVVMVVMVAATAAAAEVMVAATEATVAAATGAMDTTKRSIHFLFHAFVLYFTHSMFYLKPSKILNQHEFFTLICENSSMKIWLFVIEILIEIDHFVKVYIFLIFE